MPRSRIVILAALLFAGCSNGAEDGKVNGSPATSATPSAAEPPASSDGDGKCGSRGLPDCPLQSWMKANALPGMTAVDFGRLERALTRIASFAPDGYAGWAETAQIGASAAARHDLEKVRDSCKECHDAHRATYRARLRMRPVPPH